MDDNTGDAVSWLLSSAEPAVCLLTRRDLRDVSPWPGSGRVVILTGRRFRWTYGRACEPTARRRTGKRAHGHRDPDHLMTRGPRDLRWTVVAGYEGFASSEDALALARDVLHAAGSRLVVGCVYEHQLLGGRFAGGELATAVARRGSRTVRSGWAESTAVPGASPAEGLCRLAAAIHADLLAAAIHANLEVVGSARRALRGRLLRGSTADGMPRRGVRSVAIAPSGYSSRHGRFQTFGLPGFRRHRGGRWIRACRRPVLVLPESRPMAGDGAAAAGLAEAT